MVQRKFFENIFSKFRPVDPGVGYNLKLGMIMLSAGKKDSARSFLTRVIRKQPGNLYAIFLLGLSAFPPRISNFIWSRLRKAYRVVIWKGYPKERHKLWPDKVWKLNKPCQRVSK